MRFILRAHEWNRLSAFGLMFLNKRTGDDHRRREDETDRGRPPKGPEKDALGQSERSHKGGSNDSVSGADPRVISGKDDGGAPFPLDQDRGNRR